MNEQTRSSLVFINSNDSNLKMKNHVVNDVQKQLSQLPFPPTIKPSELISFAEGSSIPARAPNAFIIYRKLFIQNSKNNGYTFPMTVISTMASKCWKLEPDNVKKEYKRIARETFIYRKKICPKPKRERKRKTWLIVSVDQINKNRTKSKKKSKPSPVNSISTSSFVNLEKEQSIPSNIATTTTTTAEYIQQQSQHSTSPTESRFESLIQDLGLFKERTDIFDSRNESSNNSFGSNLEFNFFPIQNENLNNLSNENQSGIDIYDSRNLNTPYFNN
ncbi:2521_t:CDS:2 [Diversispora eburnea]|uniref:2521_t:CDS:1 n=1 Tax=Diversispora eburnea TaxID=1213867 RepID=A0A9N8VST6_9GLOM|nr:2521_t:CDS:2 [Diversispora eburnea]